MKRIKSEMLVHTKIFLKKKTLSFVKNSITSPASGSPFPLG
jgi:hypothetical protein